MPTESPLPQNLEALRHTMPETAAQAESASIPPGFERTLGTDGTTTFSRVSNNPSATPADPAQPIARFSRRIDWLGETSMPRAAAKAIVSGLDAFSGGANGLGLCIGTGFQWLAFLDRLPPSQMLYLFEPDPGQLRMALEICDLARSIADRRLVILPSPAEQAAAALCKFLAGNPGFDPPTVLHPPPALSGPRKNELLSAGETIVRRAVTFRQQQLAQLHESILKALPQLPSPPPIHSLAFLLSPRHPLDRPIAAAARNAGCTENQIAHIDRHFSASPLLRLQMLSGALADALDHRTAATPSSPAGGKIFSDLFREQLATVPPGIPVETWVPPHAGAAYWQRLPPASTHAPEDRLIVHGEYHAQNARAGGLNPAQITLRPLLPPTPFAANPPAPAFALRHRVALIADLPKTDSASLGIELPTHVAVFAAATEIIRNDFLAVHPPMAHDILRRSLLRAGVDPATDDPALKEPMLQMIAGVLIPALPLLVLAEKLIEQQIALLLVGDWEGQQARLAGRSKNSAAVRHLPFESCTPEAWCEAAVLLHFSPTGMLSPFLWQALESGAAILTPEHPSDRYQGSLAKILEPADFAHVSPGQLFPALKGLLKDAPRRERLIASATQTLQHLSAQFPVRRP